MPSLIESLIAGAVVRPDNVRIAVARRPAPTRPRELFEVFGALGVVATFNGAIRSLDFKSSTPSNLVNAVLGRWPTNEELAALRDPYMGAHHLRDLMVSDEFRTMLVRRICDAFPEKRRLMHVRIPSCANRYTTALLETTYPVLRPDYANKSFARIEHLSQHLGLILSRIDTARGIAVSAPTMAAFMAPPYQPPPESDYLGWALPTAPCRAIDLLFTAIRSPTSLALSQVNGTVARLAQAEPAEDLRHLRKALGVLPGADAPSSAWKRVARQLLAEALAHEPGMHRLGARDRAKRLRRLRAFSHHDRGAGTL